VETACDRKLDGEARRGGDAKWPPPESDKVRALLATGFHRSRPELAAVLELGDNQPGKDAAGLVLALFHGLLLQALLDPALAIEGDRMSRAQARLRTLLPG
jgi:hypothetical protein